MSDAFPREAGDSGPVAQAYHVEASGLGTRRRDLRSRMVVTGGAGFLGATVARNLAEHHVQRVTTFSEMDDRSVGFVGVIGVSWASDESMGPNAVDGDRPHPATALVGGFARLEQVALAIRGGRDLPGSTNAPTPAYVHDRAPRSPGSYVTAMLLPPSGDPGYRFSPLHELDAQVFVVNNGGPVGAEDGRSMIPFTLDVHWAYLGGNDDGFSVELHPPTGVAATLRRMCRSVMRARKRALWEWKWHLDLSHQSRGPGLSIVPNNIKDLRSDPVRQASPRPLRDLVT